MPTIKYRKVGSVRYSGTSMDWTSFIHHCSDARKFVIEWHMQCGSFAVESESIGMGIMRFVQTAFLTRPTVKHTRSSADTDKSARRVYVRDGPDRPISKSNTWSHIWRGPVGTNIFNFEKCCDLEVAVYATKVIPFDRPHASVCLLMFNYLGSFSVYLWAEAMAFAHFLLCFALFYSAISVQKKTQFCHRCLI